MNNKRWQNLTFGLAFTVPVIGAYVAKRLLAKRSLSNRKPHSQNTLPEVTRIRVPLTSLIGINADTTVQAPKHGAIVLPAVTPIELDEDGSPEADAAQNRLIASTERAKFHRLDCRFAQNIKPENSLFFENRSMAQAQGFKPCGACNP